MLRLLGAIQGYHTGSQPHHGSHLSKRIIGCAGNYRYCELDANTQVYNPREIDTRANAKEASSLGTQHS